MKLFLIAFLGIFCTSCQNIYSDDYEWKSVEVPPDLYFGSGRVLDLSATDGAGMSDYRGFKELLDCCTLASNVYHIISDTGMKELQSEAVSTRLGMLVTEARDGRRRVDSYRLNVPSFPPGVLWLCLPAGESIDFRDAILNDGWGGQIYTAFSLPYSGLIDLSVLGHDAKLWWVSYIRETEKPARWDVIVTPDGDWVKKPSYSDVGGDLFNIPVEYEVKILSERQRTICTVTMSHGQAPSIRFEAPFFEIVNGDRIAPIGDLIAEIKR